MKRRLELGSIASSRFACVCALSKTLRDLSSAFREMA